MNNKLKLGVSALCGSLAAVSAANAGDLTVSGGADLTWQSMDDTTTGNPIGIGSNYGLSGSGELDNGWTVSLGINMTNKNIYSNTDVTITVPALGDFIISNELINLEGIINPYAITITRSGLSSLNLSISFWYEKFSGQKTGIFFFNAET